MLFEILEKNQLNWVSWAELAELAQLSSAQENFDPVQLSSAQLSKICSRPSSAQLSSEIFLQIYNSDRDKKKSDMNALRAICGRNLLIWKKKLFFGKRLLPASLRSHNSVRTSRLSRDFPTHSDRKRGLSLSDWVGISRLSRDPDSFGHPSRASASRSLLG